MTGRPGPVLVHLGRFASGVVPLLEGAAPGEVFVEPSLAEPSLAEPVPGGTEVVATLGAVADELGPTLPDSVRWVHALGAGIDGLPVAWFGDRLVTCSRGAGAPAIAEFVLAAVLAFEKQLPDSWVVEPPEAWGVAGLGGLAGRTLGLVGVGAIGTEVARRALAFDVHVLAVRRRPGASAPDGVELVPTLDELLARSDHVVVAAPATPETYHLIGRDALAAMKQGSHLVNIARGSLVDQDALLAALDDGRLARASLDVVDPEPLPAGHPFYTHPRVRLSPHISWSSPGTGRRTIELFLDNLRRYRSGQDLTGLVDESAGY